MNLSTSKFVSAALAGLIFGLTGCGQGKEETPSAVSPPDSAAPVEVEARPEEKQPAVASNPMKDAFFGEQHMHTAYSLDAYIGGTRLTPFDSYRFAKGAEVEVNGIKHKLDLPLDWVAVTDHAEYIGEMYSTFSPGAPGHDQDLIEQLRSITDLKERQQWFAKYVAGNNRGANPTHPEFYAGPETTRSAWKDVMIAAAEQNNDPGNFTAFIAFEWTAAPGGANLHRNVIFRDSNVPNVPMSFYELNTEEKFWDWLGELERQDMKLIAIPHNSNASKTRMFGSTTDSSGNPYDEEYLQRRAHFEPLVEMMQVKGNSEVHRKLWAADEFAGFENADSIGKYSDRVLDERNFVRWGLIEGLAWQQQLGTNPFKLGFVGGTDNHNGLTSEVMEHGSYSKGWGGAHGAEDQTIERRREAGVGGWIDGKDENPGAITGVWAETNTRAALWDAMKRRETFATSGPRIKVRFFAGENLSSDTNDINSMVEQGYKLGVPMGGTLTGFKSAPTFNVQAVKSPDGANLDRVQIIKGWVDASGGHHETIVNVAWAGERQLDANGKLPPVGNTVDLETSRYSNDIGSAELHGSWTDPQFDGSIGALYYVRVFEIPTPRWTTIEATLNSLPLLEDVPSTIQERAWTSPIWYTP